MKTQEVADRLVAMCRQGQNMEAIDELYADDITSREMPGVPEEVISGIDGVRKKSEQWFANVQEFHSGDISDPVVAGNHFTCKMSFDITFKDHGRQQMEELCLYEAKDGKIINEQFFYEVPPQ
ncbi:MAG: nuclear transport factor 2 family protein [Bacteroidota bacterium]